ncbi:MAG: NADH-quinone oxidoreductase subunit NuoE [Burkholderiales bacterium]
MLSADALKKIDREIAKYPAEQKQSAVMAALIIAQDERGWLATETMDFVAHYLGMAPVAVYEVATFYNMYDLEPTAKHKLTVCTCLPCGLQGSLEAADHLKQRLGIDFNETTPDGRFTLREGECMGACAMAPVVLVNNKRMCDFMSKDKLDALIDELAGKG